MKNRTQKIVLASAIAVPILLSIVGVSAYALPALVTAEQPKFGGETATADAEESFEILSSESVAEPNPDSENAAPEEASASQDNLSGNFSGGSSDAQMESDMQACLAVMNSIQDQIRNYSSRVNGLYEQANAIPPYVWNEALSAEENILNQNNHQATIDSLRAQADALNREFLAWEATTPMGDGSMSCGYGYGPYPS